MNPRPQKIRVLIADDSMASRKIVANCFHREPVFEVTEAIDGRDTIIRAIKSDFAFDLYLIDWMMPLISGPETFEILRKLHPPQKEPLAIFVTSKSRKEDIVAALRMGVKSYIVKPFDTQSLLEKTKEVLARAGLIEAPKANPEERLAVGIAEPDSKTKAGPPPAEEPQGQSATAFSEKDFDDWDSFGKDET